MLKTKHQPPNNARPKIWQIGKIKTFPEDPYKQKRSKIKNRGH
jgi:hypothetical protein